MLFSIINILHLLYLFIPFIVLFIPSQILVRYASLIKYVSLMYLLTPVHWQLLNNRCILSILTKKSNKLQHSNDEVAFSEGYMRPMYEPIMKLFNWPWNKDYIMKMSGLHWILIVIAVWYIIFYKL